MKLNKFNILILITFIQIYSAKITVVGAGLAGLTAAYRLKKDGHDVTVYEARNRPGGRTFTCYFDQGYSELGGMNINDGGDGLYIKSLINELGLEIEASKIERKGYSYIEDNGNVTSYFELFKSAPKPTDEIYNHLKTFTNMGDALDEFLGKNTKLRTLMEKRTAGYEGADTHKLSMYYFDSFWAYYNWNYEICFSNKDGNYNSCTVKGGMSKLIEALCKILGNRINYSMPLKKIYRDQNEAHNGLKAVVSSEIRHSLPSLRQGYGGFLSPSSPILKNIGYSATANNFVLQVGNKKISSDFIVLTLPCSTLRHVKVEHGIFPDDQMDMIKTLQYGTNAKILIPTKGKTIRDVGIGNNATVMVYQNPAMWLYFGGSNGIFDSSSKKVLTKVLEKESSYISKLFPDLEFDSNIQPVHNSNKSFVKVNNPVGISWANEKFSKGSYSCLAPGQEIEYEKFENINGEKVRTVFRPIENKIFFAGEHTAIEIPSTMEGAVESGERTARMIIECIE